jgi:Domain of unknown function (DUF5666)
VTTETTPPGDAAHRTLVVYVTPHTAVWKGTDSFGVGALSPGDDVSITAREAGGALFATRIEANVVNIYGIVLSDPANSQFTFAQYHQYPADARRACGHPNRVLQVTTNPRTAVATGSNATGGVAAGQQLQIIGAQAPGSDKLLATRIWVLSPLGTVCGPR